MKKKFAILFVLFLGAVLISACGSSTTIPNNGNQTQASNSDNNPAETKSADVASSACTNAYYPVKNGLERNYEIKFADEMPPVKYSEKTTNASADNFVLETALPSAKISVKWNCTADGLLMSQYDNFVNISRGNMTANLETIEATGVTIPSEAKLVKGETWQANYKVKQTITNGPNGQVGESNGNVSQKGEVIGEEEVTVAAGKFSTVKVKVTTSIDLTFTMMGTTRPVKFEITNESWLAKGTGIVKTELVTGKGGKSSVELLGISGN